MKGEKNDDGHPLKMKLLFWIILGMVSTFFAEVISGSTPFAFFTPVGWLVVFPIYLFHILVLGSIVFRYGRPVFYVLYPAGMIFGMYETYITKTIWGSAEWVHGTVSIGGIYILPFLLLVFFFHPLISFILPLTLSEVLLTSSRSVLSYLPYRLRKFLSTERAFRRVLLIGALFLGFLWAAPTPWTVTLVAEISGMAVIISAIYLWKYVLHGDRYGMADLLPKKGEMVIVAALLVFIYILFGSYMNSRYFPGAGTQILTLAIYLVLFSMLYKNLRTSLNEGKKEERLPKINRRFALALVTVFLLASALKMAVGMGTIIFVIVALSMSVIGVYLFVLSLVRALDRLIW